MQKAHRGTAAALLPPWRHALPCPALLADTAASFRRGHNPRSSSSPGRCLTNRGFMQQGLWGRGNGARLRKGRSRVEAAGGHETRHRAHRALGPLVSVRLTVCPSVWAPRSRPSPASDRSLRPRTYMTPARHTKGGVAKRRRHCTLQWRTRRPRRKRASGKTDIGWRFGPSRRSSGDGRSARRDTRTAEPPSRVQGRRGFPGDPTRGAKW